jgi:hypothetical protein
LACKFFDSEESHSLVAEWPVVEVLEAAVLKDITAEYLAYRGNKQSSKELE